MSSGKLIMLNLKQFLGWLYYIYYVVHSQYCQYSGGGKEKASLGVLKGEPWLLPSRKYLCLCHRKDNLSAKIFNSTFTY